MSSLRCARCDINYPGDHDEHCDICEVELFETGDGHSIDWREQVERWHTRIKPGDYIINVNETVIEKDGQSFIADKHLRDTGYEPDVGDVVSIGFKFYELGGMMYAESEAPGWWLQYIDVEKEIENGFNGHPVMSDLQYARLEKIRAR